MSSPAQTMQADRLNFPGLLPREIIILKNWLALHESEWDRYAYNLRIGSGMDPGESFGADVRRGAILNSMKRIDAAAFNGPDEWKARFDAWQQTPPSVLVSDVQDSNAAQLPSVYLAAYVPDGWTTAAIIEVKDRADYRAVGQLLGYRALWRQDHPTTTDPTLILVTNRVIPDLLPTITETGVQLAVVDADFSPLKRRP
jgi:hypothetical protein